MKNIISSIKKGIEFLIHKSGVGKIRENCIYAKSIDDVPEFLLEDGAVVVNPDGSLTLYAVECPATRDFPIYICYEEVSERNADKVPGKYGAWSKDNGDETLKVVDGKCYNLPATVKATLITEDIPEWVLDAGFPVAQSENYFELVRTDWGGEVRRGEIRHALWVRYGEKDVNILALSEPSASEYIVLDQEGNDVGFLTDLLVDLL